MPFNHHNHPNPNESININQSRKLIKGISSRYERSSVKLGLKNDDTNWTFLNETFHK